jgi:dolichol-phosphate mannosyltransferase
VRAVVIIPTYNERSNITRIVPEIFASCSQPVDLQLGILVVDDNSPDGTGEAVKNMQASWTDLHLISGQKAGLGTAYIRGMTYALSSLGADVIIEMDADFSHSPGDIPRLLQTLRAGADLVIGSRYVPGGSIPHEWGFLRKANSRVGNLVAQFVAGLYPIRDCTAGFRAIRADMLRLIRLDRLRVQGYAFQVALLHELKIRGARIVEFPVDFVDRTAGESKLGASDIVEFIVNCWWIRFRSSATLIKFLLVGASGIVVNLCAFWLILSAGASKFVASPVAVEISIISNFLLNNWWTFRWRNVRASLLQRGVTFNAVSLVALLVSFTSFVATSFLLPSLEPLVHQLISIFPATVVNYYAQSRFTFRSAEAGEEL